MENQNVTNVTVSVVPALERIGFLPDMFGKLAVIVENAVYDYMGVIAPRYRGGYWEFLRISSGGGYLRAPGTEHHIECPNGFVGSVSADAAGIIATLYALSNLSFDYPSQLLAERFMQVRVLAMEHAECAAILEAID